MRRFNVFSFLSFLLLVTGILLFATPQTIRASTGCLKTFEQKSGADEAPESFDTLIARFERDSLKCLDAVEAFRPYFKAHSTDAHAALYLARAYDKVGSFINGCPFIDERFLPYVDSAIIYYQLADKLQPGIIYKRLNFDMPRFVGHCYSTIAMWSMFRHDFAKARASLQRAQDANGFSPAVLELSRLILSSCKPDAILFTYGDDDTFPIWYLQLVKGYRTDVSMINFSLFNMPWYQRLCREGEGVFKPVALEILDTDFRNPTPEIQNWDRIEQAASAAKGFDTLLISPAARHWMKEYLGSIQIPERVITKRFRHKADNFGLMPLCQAAVISVLKLNQWNRPVQFAYRPIEENFERVSANVREGIFSSMLFPIDGVQINDEPESDLPKWIDGQAVEQLLDHPHMLDKTFADTLWQQQMIDRCTFYFDGYCRSLPQPDQAVLDQLLMKMRPIAEQMPSYVSPTFEDLIVWLITEKHLKCDRDLNWCINAMGPRILARPHDLGQESYDYAVLLSLAGRCDDLKHFRSVTTWASTEPETSMARQIYDQFDVLLGQCGK
jgi:hypothetical protein